MVKASAYGLRPEPRRIQAEPAPYIEIEHLVQTEDTEYEYFNLDLSPEEIYVLKQRMLEEDQQFMREIASKENITFLLSQDCYGMQDKAVYILEAYRDRRSDLYRSLLKRVNTTDADITNNMTEIRSSSQPRSRSGARTRSRSPRHPEVLGVGTSSGEAR